MSHPSPAHPGNPRTRHRTCPSDLAHPRPTRRRRSLAVREPGGAGRVRRAVEAAAVEAVLDGVPADGPQRILEVPEVAHRPGALLVSDELQQIVVESSRDIHWHREELVL